MIGAAINRFLHWSVIGIISPILVLMILSKGIPIEMVGMIMAAMSAAVVVFEVPSGILSDLIGRRRVYLLSLAIAMLALLILYFSRGSLGIGLGFIVYGISRAFSSGSIESAYIDDHIAERGKDSLHSLISAMSIGEGSGLALGALAGGYIPLVWEKINPSGNRYGGNILAQIGILFILIILTLGTRHRERRDPRVKLGTFIAESRAFLRESALIRLLLLGVFFWGVLFSAIEVYWQPRLQAIVGEAHGAPIFGWMNCGYFLASILGNLLIGAILAKTKRASAPLIAFMRVFVGFAVILLSLQDSVPRFAFFFLTVMCLNGMMSVPEGTLFNSVIPEKKRASFLSFASLMTQSGGIAASIAFSLVKRHSTIGAIWIMAAALFLGSSVFYFRANGIAQKTPAPGERRS